MFNDSPELVTKYGLFLNYTLIHVTWQQWSYSAAELESASNLRWQSHNMPNGEKTKEKTQSQ